MELPQNFGMTCSELIDECHRDTIELLNNINIKYQYLWWWLGILTFIAVVISYLNKGEIKIYRTVRVQIPEKYKLSDKKYIELQRALNIGYIGSIISAIFPAF